MITAWVAGGPNPRKITIMLEELGWPYECKIVDVNAGEHLSPDFLAVNPNGRTPALRDVTPEGEFRLWESGAILQYLAEKAHRFLPESGPARYEVLKWMQFQMTHAPYLGNAHLYRIYYVEPMPFDIKRFTFESTRIYKVLDQQLEIFPFVAGNEYSIADIAWYPWIEYHDWQGQSLDDHPHIAAWFERTRRRPAVARGAAIPWAYGEFGPGAMGQKVKDLVERRLRDPAFALKASDRDRWSANLVAL